MRNFMLALMLSQGTPMIVMGEAHIVRLDWAALPGTSVGEWGSSSDANIPLCRDCRKRFNKGKGSTVQAQLPASLT